MYVNTNVVSVKKAVKDLKAARDILEQPNAWTRDAFARKGNNDETEVDNPKACKFCTIGAIAKASGCDVWSAEHTEAAKYMSKAMSYEGVDAYVPDVNDFPTTKQGHVLMAFDFAILMAEDDLKAAKKKVK